MYRFYLLLLSLGLISLSPLRAQQLLWERAMRRPNVFEEFYTSLILTATQQALVAGDYAPAGFTPPRCAQGPFKPYVQHWDVGTGTLLREQRGRNTPGQYGGPMWSTGSSYWWGYSSVRCDSSLGSEWYSLVYRLSAQGDTLRALLPVPLMPEYITASLHVRGNRLAIAGQGQTTSTPAEQPFCLTLADTSGNLRSHHTYPRAVRINDYPIALVQTPRGGYLLSGDGYDYTTLTFQHLLVETDSLGRQLKQRLLWPLGPDFPHGRRYEHLCNIVVLPHAGGYVLSGGADSLGTGTPRTKRSVCYLMRLDTALNVQWVYRHPTSTNGNGVVSQYPSKVRLLPDGSLGFMLRNRQALGTPLDIYLVQVDALTGQHRATYTLPSPGGYGVVPNDWHWMPDNTLLLAGYAVQSGGKATYLARWDFRQTPLVTGRPAAPAGGATLQLYPTPGTTTAPTAAHYQLPPGTSGGTLLVLDVLGRTVQHHSLPTGPRSGTLPLPGLPAGLYLVRLRPERGPSLTQRLLVQPW